MENMMRNTIYFKWFQDELKKDNNLKDYREMSINQQKDWYITWLESHFKSLPDNLSFPFEIKLLSGRNRIMIGEAFSSYLSEPEIPVEQQEQIVKVFNQEYKRIVLENK